MADPEVLVVLPTLGDRIDTLRETLESVDAQRADVPLTLAVVLPAGATEARALAEQFGAVIVDDPKPGIPAAIMDPKVLGKIPNKTLTDHCLSDVWLDISPGGG